MLWEREFGGSWAPPTEVTVLVAEGKIEDLSWHNDVCPSFGKFRHDPEHDGDDHTRLWTDHPDPEKREFDDNPRYSVVYYDPDYNHEVLYEGEDVEEAIRIMLESMKRP